ncbi:MAG TPA: peptidoglycan bridge formation glycyltransferase FemA/FemB family protein [Patescibacteria group bacterium]|nr:peptidoglycan bridge formation glycyltransferase FemA/FemB family protein [Patescibacteria group bacterium]
MKADRSIRPVDDSERGKWDALVAHPLQSWEWGEFRKSMNIDIARLGVFNNNKLIEGWQISFHKVPHVAYTIGYFPKGPEPVSDMIEALGNLGREKNAIYIQLEPNIQAADAKIPLSALFRKSHHPLFTKYTFVLDLTKSEDDLLKAMHPKTRYNIRVAQKHGVVIREDSSEKAFNAYVTLSEETTKRQGFYAHNRHYHTTMWRLFKEKNIAKLFTATYEGTIVTAWIVFLWNDTVYYPYGTSSRINRDIMAPNLMLWEIAKWAKKEGFKQFDLWGAMGPNPDTKDPWYGFHRFKEGYKPQLIEFAGSFDLVVNPLLYHLYTAADTIRWAYLHVQAKI